MTEHELKTWPPYYQAVEEGRKPFEARKADRPFAVGDVLILKEFDPERGYSGRELRRRVTYMLADPTFVRPGFVILGLGRLEEAEPGSMAEKIRAAIAALQEVADWYGQGYQVAGFHLNGDLEPLDNWLEQLGQSDALVGLEDVEHQLEQLRGKLALGVLGVVDPTISFDQVVAAAELQRLMTHKATREARELRGLLAEALGYVHAIDGQSAALRKRMTEALRATR